MFKSTRVAAEMPLLFGVYLYTCIFTEILAISFDAQYMLSTLFDIYLSASRTLAVSGEVALTYLLSYSD